VASEMPYFRHRSFVFAPASASLSTPMICSSVNRRLFIRLLPDEQTLLHSGTNLGEQTIFMRLSPQTCLTVFFTGATPDDLAAWRRMLRSAMHLSTKRRWYPLRLAPRGSHR